MFYGEVLREKILSMSNGKPIVEMAGGKGKGKQPRSPKATSSTSSSRIGSTSKENSRKPTGKKSDLLRKQERERLRDSETRGERLLRDVDVVSWNRADLTL